MGFFQKKNVNYFFSTLILCWMVISFSGCFSGDDAATPTPVPDIAISATQVEFGSVVIENFGVRTLTISNNGTSNLSIGQIASTNSLAAPFSIINDECSDKAVRPNSSCTLQVNFSPSGQESYNDAFDIPSNDPYESEITVNVAGEGKALNASINQVITENCPTVKLIVTLTDSDGNALAGLTKENFSLFEDGEEQTITDVRNVQPNPVSTVLAMDNSSSMETSIPLVNEAAKGFVSQMGASDETSIVKFYGLWEEIQEFTSDQNALNAAIDEDFAGDGTLLYDTVYESVDLVAARPNERKAVVIISDGDDSVPSDNTLTETIGHAIENGVPVFTIGLGDTNADIMQQLAQDTGGQYYNAPTPSDLAEIYLQIAELLLEQYVIEYESSSSGGGPVSLDLEIDQSGDQGEDSKQVPGC